MFKITSDDGVYWAFVSKENLEKQLNPDLSKLKDGDEVWLKAHWYKEFPLVGAQGIIAHFPKLVRVK